MKNDFYETELKKYRNAAINTDIMHFSDLMNFIFVPSSNPGILYQMNLEE